MTRLPEPKVCYQRVVRHYSCPQCQHIITGLDTTTEYRDPFPKVSKVTRIFKPCGCTVERVPEPEAADA